MPNEEQIRYRFYFQPYPDEAGDYDRVDLEEEFCCKYRRFTGLLERGEVMNVYAEEYQERSGERVYVPLRKDRAFKATECTLSLYFMGDGSLADSLRFADWLAGRKVEYYDTFRKKYFTLVLTKTAVGDEKLYGNRKFRDCTYTFRNILGTYYDRSVLDPAPPPPTDNPPSPSADGQ